MNSKHLTCALLVVAALLLGACAPAPTPAPAAAAATRIDEAAAAVAETKAEVALVGSQWQLESLFGGAAAVPVVPGTRPTLGFQVERFVGFGGCDYFLGAYTAKEDGNLDIQQPASTTGGCLNEPKAIDQQGTYMSALASTVRYEEQDGKLVLYTTGDQPVLTFAPLESAPLEGTVWDLSFTYDSKLAIWTPALPGVTAVFDGQKLSGNAGCNDYNATYTLDNGRLKLGPIAVTQKACATPEGVMEQEQAYLALLQAADELQKYPRSILLAAGGAPLLAHHAGR
jgi:heat shock protein HslJ